MAEHLIFVRVNARWNRRTEVVTSINIRPDQPRFRIAIANNTNVTAATVTARPRPRPGVTSGEVQVVRLIGHCRGLQPRMLDGPINSDGQEHINPSRCQI